MLTTMIDAKHFEAVVKRLCEEQGTNPAQISKKLGHARNWLWERFQGRSVELDTVRAVAKALKVPQSTFFARKGE